jgi:hypothetical protein
MNDSHFCMALIDHLNTSTDYEVTAKLWLTTVSAWSDFIEDEGSQEYAEHIRMLRVLPQKISLNRTIIDKVQHVQIDCEWATGIKLRLSADGPQLTKFCMETPLKYIGGEADDGVGTNDASQESTPCESQSLEPDGSVVTQPAG